MADRVRRSRGPKNSPNGHAVTRRDHKKGQPVPNDRPYGRENVTRAVLEAAAELFSQSGPAGVSLRDIAKLAGVNHALILRHFGSKEALLRATLDLLARRLSDAQPEAGWSEGTVDWLLEPDLKFAAYVRMVAWTILSGWNPAELQANFPTVRRAVAELEDQSSCDPQEVRVVVGLNSAFVLGWVLFEPYILATVGLSECDRERFIAKMNASLPVAEVGESQKPSPHV